MSRINRILPCGPLAALGLVVAMGVSPANASLLITGGTSGSVSTGIGNDVVSTVFGGFTQVGQYGANIFQSGLGTLTYTFLGYEAGFDNNFVSIDLPTGGTLDNKTNNAGDFFTTVGVNGLLHFTFNTDVGGATGSVVNGSNAGQNANTPNFFASFDGPTVVLWLDDNGGSNDGDYDDFVLRITETPLELPPVPLPSSFPLFAGGLGLLGLLWLRRRKAEPMGFAVS